MEQTRLFLSHLLQPYPILILIIGLGLARLWWKRQQSRGRLLLVTVPFVILLLLSLPPIAYVVLGTLEWQNRPLLERPEDAEAIVVLASSVRRPDAWRPKAELDELAIDRCLCASALYHQGKPCPVVLTGGKTEPSIPGPPCAELMRDFLLGLRVNDSDLIVEPLSQTTAENARRSQQLLEARGIRHIVLVTDAVHMVRAARVFRHQGFTVVPAACHHDATSYDFEWGDLIPDPNCVRSCQRVWHEWLGIGWYRLRNWI